MSIRFAIATVLGTLAAIPAQAGYWKLKEATYSDYTRQIIQRGEFAGGGVTYTLPDHDTHHFTIKGDFGTGVSVQRAHWELPATITPERPIGAMVSIDCVSWQPSAGHEGTRGPSLFIATLGGAGGYAMAGSGDQGVCETARTHSQAYQAVVPASRGGSELVIQANAMSSGTLLVNFVYQWIPDGTPPQGGADDRPAGGPASSNGGSIAGKWATDSGLMELTVTEGAILGTYDFENGRIGGTSLSGSRLTGLWVQDKAAKRCNNPVDGSYYHGHFVFDFSGGSFVGRWGYCDEITDRKWSGTRR
jgi:hypothetical protein